MTRGPGAGEPVRGTQAPARTTRERDALGAIFVVLALGLALRLIIAYLMPGSGFKVDLISYQAWSENLANEGPFGFYDRPFFHDYLPGYLYVLWLVGIVGQLLGDVGIHALGPWTQVDLLKVPPIVADLALAWLVWSMSLELGAGRRAARLAALLVVLNPVAWFDSVAWGQVDSFGAVFLLLGLRELWRDRPERAAILTVVAAIIKPQLGILVPLVAVVTIRRALWPDGGFGDEGPPEPLSTDLPWERRVQGPIRILTTGVAGLLTAIVVSLPFGLSLPGLVGQIFVAAGGYPYLSLNAYNPWALVSLNGNGIAANSLWVHDAPVNLGEPYYAFGPVPAVVVGSLLLVAGLIGVAWRVAQRPDRRTMLVGLAVLALAFFVLPTRVHERYLFPLVALGAILAGASLRWRVAYVLASAAVFANLYVVLTTLYPDNPGVRDWLGIGSTIRASSGVAAVAVTLFGVFLFGLTELTDGALARLGVALHGWARPQRALPGTPIWPQAAGIEPAERLHDATEPAAGRAEPSRLRLTRAFDEMGLQPAPPEPQARETAGVAVGASAPITASWSPRPTVIEAGYGGWLRSRLFERPIRPDRSRALHAEPGGRLDRLDLWLVVVLLASVLTLRIWRLGDPFQMHFDEVYHARTAAEFLQDWRYGISHDIYEWTHPHLAKYVMAGGLVVWGDDRVSAASDLGVPIKAAAIEPRWDDRATAAARTGDRVYVATGSEVRGYDLATRALVMTVNVPGASAVAVDGGRHQLWIGTDAGDLLTLDTLGLDAQRRSAGADAPPLSLAADPVAHVDGAFGSLFAGSDGNAIVAILADDTVVTFDAEDGHRVGSLTIPGAGQMASAGSGSMLVVTPSAVTDAAAEAILLAGIVGGAPADVERTLRSTARVAFLGNVPSGDRQAAFEAAVREGRLAGIEQRVVRRIAVASRNGVAFLDAASGGLVSTVDVGGPANGLALVTGIDTDRLYVSVDTPDGPRVVVVPVAGDASRDAPTRGGQLALPGRGGLVAYDQASQMVHVVGTAPGGSGQTVYVIEPHANPDSAGSVYADAALPFEPVGILMDANQRYPSSDREQLLTFSASGAMGAIDVGSHAFAWRLPGVIAGAILAVLLYLLARILFRRRSVALIGGLLVLADGMLFAQSRIGMNDSYVGLFIVAAYVIFTALWTGHWRGWASFYLAMPVVGLLLGLALASKWVAAYSIGALGILYLTRSALGRLLLIAGMIVATTILGYMAISVPAGSDGANLLFLLIMVGLTTVAVIASVVHPVAWSYEEQRLALWGPAALGVVVVLAALASGVASRPYVFGPVAVTPLEAGFGLLLLSGAVEVAFLLAGRQGLGPLGRPRAPDDPARWLEPAAPAPSGWLRPGSHFGLPAVWMLACLIGLPLVVYVISYLPWAFVENHQLWPGWPAGHTGQTLADLTEQMYRYHNTLTAAHPASSPWWAWPFDLKPVWFYQESFAGGTAASIYDAGNLVSWWLAVPALGFVAWQAFKRRSLALALIAIGFACQWIAWARIDRAAFQYHYYTSLPFVLVALAYFLAELWHGASRWTWLLARLSGAAVVVGPMALWLFHRPLCGFVRVDAVYPSSPSCPTRIPELLLTGRALALAVVVGLGVLLLLRQFAALGSAGSLDAADVGDDRGAAGRWIAGALGDFGPLLPLGITAGLVMAAQLVVAAVVPDTPILTLRDIAVEPLALVMLLPLLAIAAVVATARDARRFAVGCLVAIAAWFILFYPNISALPLPYAMVNTYQGLLPTYVYTFQFPVSTVDRSAAGGSLFSLNALVLLFALTVTCLALAWSAWSWRIALAAGGGFRARFGLGPREASSADAGRG